MARYRCGQIAGGAATYPKKCIEMLDSAKRDQKGTTDGVYGIPDKDEQRWKYNYIDIGRYSLV